MQVLKKKKRGSKVSSTSISLKNELLRSLKEKERELIKREKLIISKEFSILRKQKELQSFDKSKADFLALEREAESTKKEIQKNEKLLKG